MRRPRGDDGTAVVEFVYLAVLLMVPLVYVMLGVFDVQRTAFGVTEAARQAGRTWVTSDCDQTRARQAAALALRDQGVSAFDITFSPCPAAGGTGVVRVSAFAQLRGIGALVPARRGGVEVTGRFVAARDRFGPP